MRKPGTITSKKSLDITFDRVKLSKKMSKILRHRATEKGLDITPQGFVKVNDLLSHPDFQRHTFSEIQITVAQDAKQRYTLIHSETGEWLIKANQGHSMKCISDLEMTPITDPSITVIHATFPHHLPIILNEGLKPINRLHIHFAETPQLLRGNAKVHIHIDMEKCLKDKIEFFRAPNGVILSTGKDGVLPPSYFLKVENRSFKNPVSFTKGKNYAATVVMKG